MAWSDPTPVQAEGKVKGKYILRITAKKTSLIALDGYKYR
jgi:hypothetical protein